MSTIPDAPDGETAVCEGDRFLVGSEPATELRVLDVIESDDGTPMARVEAGRHDRVRYRTPVADVRGKLERGRYRRVERNEQNERNERGENQ